MSIGVVVVLSEVVILMLLIHCFVGSTFGGSFVFGVLSDGHNITNTWVYNLGNKVEVRKIKATGSADRDFLVIHSGHG